MVRLLGGNDPGRCRVIYETWLLGDALSMLEHILQEQAREDHRFQILQWSILAQSGATKAKAPKLPEILKG